jgi:hypothetical protein
VASSGMLRRVSLLRTDVSEERSTSIIRVIRIGELVNTNVVPSPLILVTLIMDLPRSSETSVLTRTTRCNILQNEILPNSNRN